MTAGVLAMVPASPMPLAPIGLVGLGVVVWSSVKLGSSAADGHQVVHQRRVLERAVVVVHGLLEERLGDALDDAAVHLALDDERVHLVAAVVDGDVVDQVDLAGLGVDLDHRDVASRTGTRSSAGPR